MTPHVYHCQGCGQPVNADLAALIGHYCPKTRKPLTASEMADEVEGRAPLKREIERLTDTIAAQSRLLELAETLAGAVQDWVEEPDAISKAMDLMMDTAQAFTAAQADYHATGAVPCGECEVKLQQLAFSAQVDAEQGQTIIDLMNERDDLRRQLAEAQKDVFSKACVLSVKYLDRAEAAEIDNAALVEALKDSGEFIHDDACDGSHEFSTEDSDDCTCGATRLNRSRRTILSQPHPGDRMLERMAALERENEALRKVEEAAIVWNEAVIDTAPMSIPECVANEQLQEALKTLDAIRNREGR